MALKRLISICTLFLLVVSSLHAQRRKPQNQPYADLKRYHFGFHVGVHMQDLILTNSGASTDGERWFAEIPSYSPGLSVGVIGNLYINQYLNVRLTPTVHFGDRRVSFVREGNNPLGSGTFATSLRSNYLWIPLDLKYTAMRLNNYRPYLTAGAYTAFDLGRKRGNPLLLKGLDFGLAVGAGCDIYLPYFKLCPEIKFCFGLADVLERNRPDLISDGERKYTNALSRATSRMIVLTFNFE